MKLLINIKQENPKLEISDLLNEFTSKELEIQKQQQGYNSPNVLPKYTNLAIQYMEVKYLMRGLGCRT